ncbi:hypothetical protein [Acinetobacter nosocomialis]|uniref:hypothetical protein n=1 Tax=Acinetobacter nosocomialis TaxID=106654 RepID=UPI0024B85C07|nr:hypothetical protein [Acinetobacter nosocomialis]MDI9659408.1 hypothetical protein [Acinetobacter nosocomialis]
MKPEQFIREYGVEKAREVVEGAPESASLVFYYFDEVNDELLGPEYYRDNGSQHFNKENNSWGFCLDPQIIVTEPHDALVSVEDLKRLVESVELVEVCGGLVEAKKKMNSESLRSATIEYVLYKAIRDHESIYGGGDE